MKTKDELNFSVRAQFRNLLFHSSAQQRTPKGFFSYSSLSSSWWMIKSTNLNRDEVEFSYEFQEIETRVSD